MQPNFAFEFPIGLEGLDQGYSRLLDNPLSVQCLKIQAAYLGGRIICCTCQQDRGKEIVTNKTANFLDLEAQLGPGGQNVLVRYNCGCFL